MSGACDYCSSAKALVFCRADSARLCLACDAQVRHATSRTPPPGAPSRRRWVAQCGRARSSAPAFRRDRASPTPSPVARTRRDRPSRERARAPVEPPPARVVAKFVARASALVNTDADGCAFSFPRIPLTRSPTSRAQVHTANHVARRHARSWLCEHCHNGSGTVRARSPERGDHPFSARTGSSSTERRRLFFSWASALLRPDSCRQGSPRPPFRPLLRQTTTEKNTFPSIFGGH